MHRRVAAVGAVAVGLLTAAACGSRSQLPAPRPLMAEGGGGAGGGGGMGGGPPECVVFDSSAELAPLDLFVMADTSGSMGAEVQGATTKWEAVQQAFSAFFYDQESQGIGVALSFFPIVDPAVPEYCVAPSDCGVGAESLCQPGFVCSGSFIGCDTDQDCADAGMPDETCIRLGHCQGALGQAFCVPQSGLDCDPGTGPCIDYAFCENRFTCDVAPYATPALEVETLPGGTSPLLQTLGDQFPEGGTPTLPALVGAVQAATDWADDNPTHKVIVVLTTDGFPTVCDPELQGGQTDAGVENLVEAAATGSAAGIDTFVIGVFAPEEAGEAQANLDLIADAGGTGEAFIVNAGGAVSNEFLEALNTVRLTAKACEFDLAPSDEPIDYATVWVRLTPQMGQEVWVARVDGEESCGDGPGFYFDPPIGGVDPPERVILCPSTCTLLGASPNRTVEIFTTCPDPTTP